MKNKIAYVPLLSILLNLYCWTLWIYSFNHFSEHRERVSFFLSFFVSTEGLTFSMILLTVPSIVILAKKQLINKLVTVFLFIVQIMFLALNLFQLM